jgi:crotonobetainyl-CoA:carnitine CoA-transferase CaiB-like acyl-CoA transferase
MVVRAGGVNFMVEQCNRSKRSVGIDLATDGGRDLLYRLAATSDVFLTSFLPDARQKLKIDVGDIRAVNPRIIYARGSGQGPKGPDAGKGGYDAASFWCRGGLAHALTPPDAESPTMQRAAYGDSVGAMTIAGGIAAALLHRERTGEAPVVDISLLATAMWMTGADVVAAGLIEGMGSMPRFTRRTLPNPLVNSYKTKDGRWIQLNMLQADKFWADFCRHIDREDLATDPRFAEGPARYENREACVAEIDAVMASRTLAEWRERFDTMAGVWAPMQSARELYDDPQAIANGYLQEIEAASGTKFALVSSPVQFDQAPPSLRHAPEMGEQTDEVLTELGLSQDELMEYKVAGAIL